MLWRDVFFIEWIVAVRKRWLICEPDVFMMSLKHIQNMLLISYMYGCVVCAFEHLNEKAAGLNLQGHGPQKSSRVY
jgi:hypothetical protein